MDEFYSKTLRAKRLYFRADNSNSQGLLGHGPWWTYIYSVGDAVPFESIAEFVH